ncbi:YicC family protein [Candidatus Babeliales bacterium]|nr:YicC family protein [Candidatus Babeliales bacterium]
MTQSMTGFASSTAEITISKTEKISLSLNLKTLNSRYFEVTCKLPYLLTNLEVALQRTLKKKLDRGHVYLVIKIQQNDTSHAIIPAVKTIQEYVKAIQIIKKECGIKEEISLSTLLQLPNILQIEDDILNSGTEEKIVEAVNHIADQLIKTRLTEGLHLEQDIIKQTNSILAHLKNIQKSSTKVCTKRKKDLETVLKKLDKYDATDTSVDKMVLEQQKNTLLAELEKMDINEEIVRTTSHIQSIHALFKDKNLNKGKKLDFTLQEINREINTIASKCCDSTISSLTIDVKTDIEKAREQAQNIV